MIIICHTPRYSYYKCIYYIEIDDVICAVVDVLFNIDYYYLISVINNFLLKMGLMAIVSDIQILFVLDDSYCLIFF